MGFYSIHIVSHILSSNGGFLSHGTTPWHHPVVMNEPANWFPSGPIWPKKSWPESQGWRVPMWLSMWSLEPSGAHLGTMIQNMGSNSGNCVQLPSLEIWKITGRNVFYTSSQARNNDTTKTWRPNIKVSLCTTQQKAPQLYPDPRLTHPC